MALVRGRANLSMVCLGEEDFEWKKGRTIEISDAMWMVQHLVESTFS